MGNRVGNTHVFVERGTVNEVKDLHPNHKPQLLGQFPAVGYDTPQSFVVFFRGRRRPSDVVIATKMVEAGYKIEGLSVKA